MRGAGKLIDFVAVDGVEIERVWKLVEDNIPAALAAAKAGTVLGDPSLTGVLRDVMVLHYVRAPTTPILFQRVFEEAYPQQVRGIVHTYRAALVAGFRRELLGLHPAGDGALEWLVERHTADTAELLRSPEYVRVRMEETFQRARQFAKNWPLEIVTAAEGEFLIGDVPVVTTREGGDAHGMLAVALGDAGQIVMPLTPYLAASVGPEPLYGSVGADVVDEINRRQVLTAVRRVFHRPGADFHDFITRHRP
ncbi:MAG: DUF4238 domain-containing protein [Mycobacteriales bacterium]